MASPQPELPSSVVTRTKIQRGGTLKVSILARRGIRSAPQPSSQRPSACRVEEVEVLETGGEDRCRIGPDLPVARQACRQRLAAGVPVHILFRAQPLPDLDEIGRAHVRTPVTN